MDEAASPIAQSTGSLKEFAIFCLAMSVGLEIGTVGSFWRISIKIERRGAYFFSMTDECFEVSWTV
jgi:hypothetical protein